MKRNAFSLVELLTVLGVCVILMGILFPVLSSAKHSAYRATDTATLRNFAVAASLYQHDHDDIAPTSIIQLNSLKYIPDQLLVSPGDPTKGALAQCAANVGHPNIIIPLQLSYAAASDIGVPLKLDPPLAEDGWVVAFSDPATKSYQGRCQIDWHDRHYLRLTNDGSVLNRVTHPKVFTGPTWRAEGFATLSWFTDRDMQIDSPFK